MATATPAAAKTEYAEAKEAHQDTVRKRYCAHADFSAALRALLAALEEERDSALDTALVAPDDWRKKSYKVAASLLNTIRHAYNTDAADLVADELDCIYTHLMSEKQLNRMRAEATEACDKRRRVAE